MKPLPLAPAASPPSPAGAYPALAAAALATTLLGGSALGAILLWRIHAQLAPVPEGWVQAHARLQIFGFVAVLVTAVAGFALPRFWEVPPPPRRAVQACALALLAGALLEGAALLAQRPASPPLVALGAGLVAGGAIGFGLLVVGLARAAGRWRPEVDRYLLAGTAWLVAAAGLEAWNALRGALHHRPALWGVLTAPTYAMLLYGFAGSWILGVGLRILVGPRPERIAAVFPFWQGAVALAALAPALARPTSFRVEGLADLLRVAVAAVVLNERAVLFGMRDHGIAGERRRERLVRGAWAFLGLHAILALWLAGRGLIGLPPIGLVADAARHAYAIGFLGLMILGMGSRMFPRFSGRPVPAEGLRDLGAGLIAAGTLLRALEALTAFGWPWLLAITAWSGFLVLAGMLLGFGPLIAALRPVRSG